MRKIIVLTFVSLDGVMQAPGGPEEDKEGGFKYGGWTYYYSDDFLGNVMDRQIGRDFDLLLGRKTYEIFASYWPFADPQKNPVAGIFNNARKYVVSKTLKSPDWNNSRLINNNAPAEIRKLKESPGPDLQVYGSGKLVQTLMKHGLADELWLKIYPVTLGTGKRLFEKGIPAAGFELTSCESSPSGVIIANYRRAGEVRTGTIGE